MANELQLSVNIAYANGSAKDKKAALTFNVTQATQGLHMPIVSVGSGAEEDLSLGDIATNGYIWLKNLDAVNFVKYGPKSGGVMVEFGRLKAGEEALLRLAPGVTWRWIADTAAVKVQVKAFEN